MQLSRRSGRNRIAGSLAAATCALLSVPSAPSIVAETPLGWSFDAGFLYYGEQNGRVSDGSLSFGARRLWVGDRALTLSLTADSLTGASASGAVPATTPQTFTSPSGNKTYTTPAGERPLDSTFLDTRIAITAGWAAPAGRRAGYEVGLSGSDEYDYLHMGVNGRYHVDFNQRNTTLSVGAAYASDTIDPVGGAPRPLTAMRLIEVPGEEKLTGGDEKQVVDLLVGVSQVLGRRTIAQLNYGYSRSTGYLDDPYKILSVVDPVSGDPVPGPDGLYLYRYEGRPDERTKHSLFFELKHSFGRDVIDGDYRYMTDDWGVQSHTLDLRYRFKLGRDWYLQPHLRYYRQSAADFYAPWLLDGAPLPQHASADYRLGEFDALTLGLKYGRPFGDDKEWSARVEYYAQSGADPPLPAVGSLSSFDLDPGVDAVIVQLGLRF